MDITIAGYNLIETIYEGTTTLVYRAAREANQPSVIIKTLKSEYPTTETQNRFNRVFQQFIHVFCKPSHPLVLFLDDLQWADSASLKLIQLLISNPDSQYLLLIGADRDNEVHPTHPLMLTLEEIQESGAVVSNIVLQSLQISKVQRHRT